MNTPSLARTWTTAVITAALLSLTACGPTAPAETYAAPTGSTPSATPTETSTPTPTPTPTAEAEVEDPAQIGTWIIDGVGIGPLDIGGDPATLPTYLPGVFDDACNTKIFERDDGLAFTMPVGEGSDQIYAIKLSGGPAALANAPHTAAGVGLGSTSAQVEADYPGIAFEDDGVRTPHYVWPTDGRFVHILLKDGAVSGFFVSAFEKLSLDLC
jgi:hypothetical protein